jgi:hypothetical protein
MSIVVLINYVIYIYTYMFFQFKIRLYANINTTCNTYLVFPFIIVLNAHITYSIINNEGHLRGFNEIYPFKQGLAKLFQKFVKVPLNPKCIDIIPSLTIIITFHDTFKILLCLSNTKKVVI